MVAIRLLHPFPPLDGCTLHLYVMLRLGVTLRSSSWPRVLAKHLFGFRQFLAGVSDMPSQGERRGLHQIMYAMKEVGHAQTL
jgi:hypothetical protein